MGSAGFVINELKYFGIIKKIFHFIRIFVEAYSSGSLLVCTRSGQHAR